MKNIIIALILALTPIPLSLLNANILHVPNNYPTIQSAINSSLNGDTILVAPGIYYENVNFRGKGVLLSSNFLINHDTSFISNTVINGSSPIYPDTASCVIMTKPDISSASETSAALVGFTLTGGNGTVWPDLHFPGYVYREGGGIFIQYWSPRIQYNRIIGNHIEDALHPDGGGGGIRCCDGNPLIENNVIQNNSGYCGMSINLYFSSGIIRNNIITGNYGGRVWGGGAIYMYGNYLNNPILIENNTVVNNSSINGCGGLRPYLSNNVTIKNNIIWGNLPVQIYQTGGVVSISYSDIQGGWSGTGNLNTNPQFANNSYYLNSASQCIDAGDSSVSNNDPEDPLHTGLAMWPSLGTLRNDMGVFGGPHSTVIGSSVVAIKEYGNQNVISNFVLYQNYPNPFNPTTNIRYDLPKNGFVKLVVFDMLGKEVETLVKEKQSAGTYEAAFNGSHLSSGIYFARFESGNISRIIKMLMVK